MPGQTVSIDQTPEKTEPASQYRQGGSEKAHRGKAEAYDQDEKARAIARHMLAKGLDRELPQRMRVFCYLPLEHSEDMTDQEDCLALMSKLDEMEGVEDYSRQHRDIIARFGRFPHRNAALGRRSTAEEAAFLKEPGSSF